MSSEKLKEEGAQTMLKNSPLPQTNNREINFKSPDLKLKILSDEENSRSAQTESQADLGKLEEEEMKTLDH